MNRIIFVEFEDEKAALQGDQALHEMHRDGSITMYADAVVAKDKTGKVVVLDLMGKPPLATAGGLLIGSLIGLLGGPISFAVAAGAGAMAGAALDVTRAGIEQDFVEDVGERLALGKAVVIAEIDEERETPLDTVMESLGGTIVRRTRTQIEDAYFERGIETHQKELASLEAEKIVEVEAAQAKEAEATTARIQAKIDAVKKRIEERRNEFTARIRSVKEEGDEKIAALQAQMDTANREAKAILDRRLAEVRSDYEHRIQKLTEVLHRRKTAHAHA